MSDVAPTPSPAAFPPPPPGLNYLATIEPALTFSLLGAFFAGLLIPMFVFLFLLSTPTSRKYPVFIMNVIVLLLGFALAIVNNVQEWSNLVTPLKAVPRLLTLANVTLAVLCPMIIDSVLIFRFLAFYPRVSTPRSKIFKVLAFPIIIKIGRLTCVTLFLARLNHIKGDSVDTIGTIAEKTWFRNPFLVAEWSLQIIDNLYSTTFFFWKLRKTYKSSERRFLIPDQSLLPRIRKIIAISLANFVFPLFMNITQLILITDDTNYPRGAEVLLANMYVSIIGVMFATVWASGNAWGRQRRPSDRSAFETTFSEHPGYVEDNDPEPDLLEGDKPQFSASQERTIHVEQLELNDLKGTVSRDTGDVSDAQA